MVKSKAAKKPAKKPLKVKSCGVKTGLPKPPALRKKMDGMSLGSDAKGYFVYTHRWRSESFKSPEAIPAKILKFCESTG